MRRPIAFALTAVLSLALAGQALAQRRPPRPEPAATATPDEPGRSDRADRPGPVSERVEAARENKISDADIATAPVHEARKITHHIVTINGKAIPYEATAGTLTLRDDAGKPMGSMFYVAYTAKGGPNRPVTFFYNGGPGSATLWLHMGSFGPVRVRTDSPQPTANAPFTTVNNNDSLLDKTDLVFLDAMGSGYSRALGDTKPDKFYGVDQDIDAFTRAITRWINVNSRWNSPKFLFGESYGTTRSAGLVYALQESGVQMNGVMLLSSILNYGSRDPGFDHNYISLAPTYAAAAWYHDRVANKPADLPSFLREVRDWARGPYAAALAKGDAISPAEFDATAQQMNRYFGISTQFAKEADLRIDLSRFRKELLRDQRRTIGRYDSRFEGIDLDAAGESPETDPSSTGITGAFMGAFHSYIADDLGYHTDLTYVSSAPGANQAWDWKHRAPGQGGGQGRPQLQPDTALDLAAAMRANPHLKVYSLNGWYDMATPFFGTEYDLHHMQLDPTLRGNLEFAYYPSGHMVYLNTEALKQMKADVARFYDEAAPQ